MKYLCEAKAAAPAGGAVSCGCICCGPVCSSRPETRGPYQYRAAQGPPCQLPGAASGLATVMSLPRGGSPTSALWGGAALAPVTLSLTWEVRTSLHPKHVSSECTNSLGHRVGAALEEA